MSNVVTQERIERHKQARFNPIKRLTPDRLARQLEDFTAGRFNEVGLTFDAIERRDDVLKCVIAKRKAAIKRRTWEIITDPDAPESEAQRHADALKFFYKNLECRNALDANQRGGFSMLVEQMMDAVAKGYAAHEIIWRPAPDGLTARFNFVPIWFFENRLGRLRFLVNDYDQDGRELEPGGWMVTCGEGLMEACSVAYQFKRIGMQDWMAYCERHGMPAIHGQTNAQPGTPEHDAMQDIVGHMASEFSCVTSKEEIINIISTSAQGQLPYPDFVERMDRALVALWRGADLSTMSKDGQAVGSNAQNDESHSLEQDDAQKISETLNEWVDKLVIQYAFGDVKPLAYVKVVVPPKLDVEREIKIDEHLVKHGVGVGKRNTLERFQRPELQDGDEELEQATPPAVTPGIGATPPGRRSFFANERAQQTTAKLVKTATQRLGRVQGDALEPLMERLDAVFDFQGEAFGMALRKLREDLPEIMGQLNLDPPAARELEASMSAALFNGFAEGFVDRHTRN